MTVTTPSKVRRNILVGGLLLLLSFGGMWAALFFRPAIDEHQVALDRAAIAAHADRLARVECRREPLSQAPVAAGFEAVSLRGFIDAWEHQGQCLRVAESEAVVNALSGESVSADGVTRYWGFDITYDDAPLPPAERAHMYLAPQHPPFPADDAPPAYLALEAACPDLAPTLQALAASTGACSPYPARPLDWDGSHIEVVALGRAVSVVARASARAGDLGAAFHTLLDGVALMQDLRRGPANALTAMLSAAGESQIWSTFLSLLMSLTPDETLRSSIAARIDALQRAWPHPHHLLQGEVLALSEAAGPGAPSEARATMERLAARFIPIAERVCPAEGDGTACFEEPSPEVPEEASDLERKLRALGGARIALDLELESMAPASCGDPDPCSSGQVDLRVTHAQAWQAPASGPPCQSVLNALADFFDGRQVAVLTGAGISTESGIPDYRGPETRKRARNPMRFAEFTRSPEARARYWARSTVGWERFRQARPNAGHAALVRLEEAGRIQPLITQNVDRLHHAAGSRGVVELHGALAEVRCLECGAMEDRDALQVRIRAQNPAFDPRVEAIAPDGDADVLGVREFNSPVCSMCAGVLKPHVVFFGENVPRERVDVAYARVDEADALLVVGSSLAVFSGFRFVRRAHDQGKPVALVNLGESRGDPYAALRVQERAGDVLPALVDALLGKPS